MTLKWSGLLIFYSFKVFLFIYLPFETLLADCLCFSIKRKLRESASTILSREIQITKRNQAATTIRIGKEKELSFVRKCPFISR